MRLDQFLVDKGYFDSRTRAQAAVKAGLVSVDSIVVKKPSQSLTDVAQVFVTGDVHDFVSRGGVKLDHALGAFKIDVRNKICLDLGASTGGFSDVLLRAGAAKIYAVDVGEGQLHKTVASDPRVINLEKTHAKNLSRALIPDAIGVIVCDVSFISLKKALPPAMALAGAGARMVALVKPQFEVGRSRIGKGGVVKPGHENTDGVAEDIVAWLNDQPGWRSLDYIESPIKGGDGNREFLIGAVKSL